jgi:uracil phosphoribosyltransferase
LLLNAENLQQNTRQDCVSQAKIISVNVLRAALLRAPAVCSKIPPSPISPALWHSEFRTMSREYGKSTGNSNRNTMVLFGDAQQMREEIVKAME